MLQGSSAVALFSGDANVWEGHALVRADRSSQGLGRLEEFYCKVGDLLISGQFLEDDRAEHVAAGSFFVVDPNSPISSRKFDLEPTFGIGSGLLDLSDNITPSAADENTDIGPTGSVGKLGRDDLTGDRGGLKRDFGRRAAENQYQSQLAET